MGGVIRPGLAGSVSQRDQSRVGLRVSCPGVETPGRTTVTQVWTCKSPGRVKRRGVWVQHRQLRMRRNGGNRSADHRRRVAQSFRRFTSERGPDEQQVQDTAVLGNPYLPMIVNRSNL